MAKALITRAGDNVATLLTDAAEGEIIEGSGIAPGLVAGGVIPRFHKVALNDLALGSVVVKYGNPIGEVTAQVRRGEHVHTHNLASLRARRG